MERNAAKLYSYYITYIFIKKNRIKCRIIMKLSKLRLGLLSGKGKKFVSLGGGSLSADCAAHAEGKNEKPLGETIGVINVNIQ